MKKIKYDQIIPNFQNYIKNSKNHHILIRLGLIDRVFPKLFTYTNQTCGTSLGSELENFTKTSKND